LGRYNPQTDPSTIDFDERIRHCLEGSEPSNTVQRLLKAKEFSG
jgi:ribosomal protein S16